MTLKVWTAPEVHLLASNRPRAGWEALFPAREWLDQDTEPVAESDRLCETAGRLCYGSFGSPRPGGNKAYLARIKEQGHGEVLEFASATLLLRGLSFSCARQLTRYRTFSFCQRSSRFCDEGQIGVICPPAVAALGRQHPVYETWWKDAVDSVCSYEHLKECLKAEGTLSRKEVNEAARSLLPQCAATELVAQANMRGWRHLLEQRCSAHADAEVRRVACAAFGVLRELAPELLSDYTPTVLPDGSFTLSTPHKKV